ncbi:MAG TPA: hypothetical protein VLA82_05920 [Actinomycetota bacterium]|nr:hypothetical protein [Actinomycetota bacterium]
MERKTWDQLISGAGAVLAAVFIVVGALAVFGGNFGRDNVTDRLEPQKVQFPPTEAMSPEELDEVGDFAGQQVVNGEQAEAYSRYIGLHLAEVNEGATYAETSSAAREEGIEPELAAELQGKADTLFKGETLRSILLNAYGWWTVATIAVYAGYAMVAAGILLAVFAALGFMHARRASTVTVTRGTPATKEPALQR